MTNKKDKKWADDHLIIEMDGLSKKQKDVLKQKIMEKVAKNMSRKKS